MVHRIFGHSRRKWHRLCSQKLRQTQTCFGCKFGPSRWSIFFILLLRVLYFSQLCFGKRISNLPLAYLCVFRAECKKTLYKVDIDEVGWKSAGCCFGVAGLSFVLYHCYFNCNSVQTFISGLVPVPLLAAPLRHAIINEPREGFVFSFLLFGVIGRI